MLRKQIGFLYIDYNDLLKLSGLLTYNSKLAFDEEGRINTNRNLSSRFQLPLDKLTYVDLDTKKHEITIAILVDPSGIFESEEIHRIKLIDEECQHQLPKLANKLKEVMEEDRSFYFKQMKGCDPVKRIVVCAANQLTIDGELFLLTGARHWDPIMHNAANRMGIDKMTRVNNQNILESQVQGFIDQFGTFLNRADALKIASHAGQIDLHREKKCCFDELYSEDLY